MRKALGAGIVAVAVLMTAALIVRAQTKEPYVDEPSDRRVVMLDGRGSTIGVSIRDVEADDVSKSKLGQTGGVVIDDVEESSPAERAGLRKGDVVVEFDGERVRSARHFARLVQETPSGRAVKATVVRDGARQALEVTPSSGTAWSADWLHLPHLAGDIQREVERGMRSMPKDFAFDFTWEGDAPDVGVWPRGRLGARLMVLPDQLAEYFGAKQGVLVSSVDDDSLAAKAGLKAGDVITSVGGEGVETPRDVAREVRQAAAGKDLEIIILRDRKSVALKVPVPERRRPEVRRPSRPA